MDYSEARPRIKSGDLLAWTHRSWGSWYDFQVQLVRIATASEYAHVGIAYVVGERVFVLESVTGGIRQVLLSEKTPFYWMPTGIEWNDALTTAAMSKMGQKYSKLEGILSLWKKIKPGSNGSWECAEFVRYIAIKSGLDMDCRNLPSECIRWFQDNIGAPLYTVNKTRSLT